MPGIFPFRSFFNLARAALFHTPPAYVQFYITARCNLACRQCNICAANADLTECSLDQIKRIADNLAKAGTGMVLLTGGEPFMRADLPEIVRAFQSRGIHVRMQTNGLADEEAIRRVIEAGGNDISISLDTLVPETQEAINGGVPGSWHRAIKAISLFTQYLPAKNSFASLGCVLQRANFRDIEDVIRFGTRIGWFTSLVPVHTTGQHNPRGFCAFDRSLMLTSEQRGEIDTLIDRVKAMQKEGFLVFHSNRYYDNFKAFVHGQPLTWRDGNSGVCDSPNLYFAILPNGEMAPCCDWRLDSTHLFAYADDFCRRMNDPEIQTDIHVITAACPGCLYGSFPEITISMRHLDDKIRKTIHFLKTPPRPGPYSYEEMLEIAAEIRNGPSQ